MFRQIAASCICGQESVGRAAGVGLGAGILLFEFYALRHRHRAGGGLLSRRLAFWWSLITWPAIVLLILEVHFQVLEPFTRSRLASGVCFLRDAGLSASEMAYSKPSRLPA